jgi:hypothetical protein
MRMEQTCFFLRLDDISNNMELHRCSESKHSGVTAGVQRQGEFDRQVPGPGSGRHTQYSVCTHVVITHRYLATLACFAGCHCVNLDRVAHWKPSELVTTIRDNVFHVTSDKTIRHVTHPLEPRLMIHTKLYITLVTNCAYNVNSVALVLLFIACRFEIFKWLLLLFSFKYHTTCETCKVL